MGAFFTNFQIHGDSPDGVADTIKELVSTRAFVSGVKNRWITVYDEDADSQDRKRIQQLGKELSARLQTSVFAFVVQDSDVLLYWLYAGGKLSDHYNSRPDYFAPAGEEVDAKVWKSLEGNPAILLPYCVPGTKAAALRKILHREPMGARDILNTARRKKKHPYDFEEQRLRELACLLGIDENRACLGFHDLDQGGAGNRKEFRLVKRKAPARGKKK